MFEFLNDDVAGKWRSRGKGRRTSHHCRVANCDGISTVSCTSENFRQNHTYQVITSPQAALDSWREGRPYLISTKTPFPIKNFVGPEVPNCIQHRP